MAVCRTNGGSPVVARCIRRRSILAAVAAPALFARTSGAYGQTESYPSRPITIIAPLAAGSAADSLIRDLVQQLSGVLGQPAVVVNRVGAGGNIGTTAIARSAPDGYTIGQVSQGNMVINMALYRDTGYDPVRDFAPIAVVAAMSNVMVVSRQSPHRSVGEVVEAIRAKPQGIVTYSSSGVGTSMHVAGAIFARATRTELTHVPYTGAPAAMTAIISGEVDTGFFNIPAAKGLIAAGDLRPLAVTTARRSASLPELPTLEEAGLRDYDVSTWLGLVAPAGTPPAIIERVHGALTKVLSRPALRERLTAQGFDLPPLPLGGPAEFSRLIRDDLAKWPAIMRETGVKPE